MSSHAYLLDNLITPPLALRSRTLSSTLPYTCYSGPMSHPRPSSPPALPSPLCLAYHHPSAYLATNPPPLQGPPTSRLRVCELSLTLLPLPSLAFPFPRPHPSPLSPSPSDPPPPSAVPSSLFHLSFIVLLPWLFSFPFVYFQNRSHFLSTSCWSFHSLMLFILLLFPSTNFYKRTIITVLHSSYENVTSLLSKERRVTYISQWISPISVTFHTQSQCIEIWGKNHHIRLYIRSLPLMDYFHE